jgi:hypothetical protein
MLEAGVTVQLEGSSKLKNPMASLNIKHVFHFSQQFMLEAAFSMKNV